MKKLLVLSVLLGLLALPIFASHVSIDMGGDMTFGFIGDFGDNENEDTDLTWDVIVGIDDFNSFTWSLKGLDTAPAVALDKALVTTNIGKWLGLEGFGLKVMWGWDDPDANEFGDVSGYGSQAYDFSPGEYWGVGILASWNFLELEMAFDPAGKVALTNNGRLLIGAAVKEPIPGLNAEVYYFQGGDVAIDVFDAGNIGIGAAYSKAFGDIDLEAGVSFEYEMDDTALSAWDYAVGVAVGYGMFDVTADVEGMDGSEFDALRATVDVAAVEKASIYAGLALSFADGADTFQGADLGVNLHVGIVEVYLGYLVTSNGAGDYNAPETLTDGGAYLKFDVDY